MSVFLNLVAGNFHILFVLSGFAYFLISQKDTPASVEKKYYWLMFACSLILLIVVPLELWTAKDIKYYDLRVLLSVIAYWVRPAAIMFLVFSCTKKSKKRIFILIPELLNIILIGTALFGDHAFYYDKITYKFIRLPLGYAPHIAAVIYVTWLMIILIREVTKGFKIESGILFICIFFSTVGLLYTMFTGYEFVSFSIAASGFFHYLFIRASRHYEEITKQINDLEEARYAADKANATKTQFLLNMSHDIRTPMNAIIGYSEIIRKNPDDTQKVQDYAKKMQISGGYLLSLINEVLEMSKIESGNIQLNKTPTHIGNIIESVDSVFGSQIEEKNINYQTNINITNEYIYCDATKFFEILFNLISNSIKYTPNGGSITIDVNEFYTAPEETTQYQIVIRDTGMGISKEFLPHVFEEFSREKTTTDSKIAGTGLGMPIVKKLIDLMDGTIEIDSTLNVGTTVTVSVPAQLASVGSESTTNVTTTKAGAPKDNVNVLLVEDNDFNAEVAIALLEDEHYTVSRASDGSKCLEMIQNSLEPNATPYDIILMDIQMPVLDGYETTKLIRANGDSRISSLPIIAMTANAFAEDRQQAIQAGMNSHISKPIDVDRLKKEINKFVN